MTASEQLQKTIRELLDSQIQGVLATLHGHQPYTSLMAFAVTPDLRWIIFATHRKTRKHANLLVNPNASLLIDNRTNEAANYHDIVAVSAGGKVREVDVAQHDKFATRFLSEHPDLNNFLAAADCALLQLDVHSYSVVSEFQNVTKLRMT